MDISLVGSDAAADMVFVVEKAILKVLKKELPEKGGGFNTDGVINVAMFFDEVLCTSPYFCTYADDNLIAFAQKVIFKLEKYVIIGKDKKQWDDEANRIYHLDTWQRLLDRMKKFVQTNEEK